MTACCSKCHRPKSQMTCILDVYNDEGDEPGILVCDDCIDAEDAIDWQADRYARGA